MIIKQTNSNLSFNSILNCNDLLFNVLSFLDFKSLLAFEGTFKGCRALTDRVWQELRRKDSHLLELVNHTARDNYLFEEMLNRYEQEECLLPRIKNAINSQSLFSSYLNSPHDALKIISHMPVKKSGEYHLMMLCQLKHFLTLTNPTAEDLEPIVKTTLSAIEWGSHKTAHRLFETAHKTLYLFGQKIIYTLAERGDFKYLDNLVQLLSQQDLEALYQQNQKFPPVLAKLAAFYCNSDTLKADQFVQDAITGYGHRVPTAVLTLAGIVKCSRNSYSEAVVLFEQVIARQEPIHCYVKSVIAKSYAYIHEWVKADQVCQQAIKESNPIPASLLGLYATISFHLNDLDVGNRMMAEAIHCYHNGDRSLSMIQLMDLGTIQLNLNKYQEAYVIFSIIIEYLQEQGGSPSNKLLLYTFKACFNLKNWSACDHYIQWLISLSNADFPPEIWYHAAYAQIQLNQFETANICNKKAILGYQIKNVPVPYHVWFWDSYTKNELNETNKAISSYKEAFQQNSSSHPLKALEGLILLNMGHQADALSVLANLKEINYSSFKENYESVAWLKNQFKSLIFA